MNPKQMERYLKTIGDQSRLQLLKALEQKPLCICDLNTLLDVSQPAISQHMYRLKSDEIVLNERRGRWVYWSLNSSHPHYLLLLELLKLLPVPTIECSKEENPCK
ncbi:metalloregulator ArsR/SmtB family transcription factor [Sporosarcina sp. P1]|uniref:ArsR/SmtB family transcription factor n=1 Tax=Sporosarcina sp. P1 TaxID=2048257 RepID=UPI000C167DA6|nr:metalloregulator ArsR/SmtB family transcription factor [Sporosarcina sp. P1]PIC82177.1 transcriptional regulator [Sporosarcina sp. P1]